MKWSANLYLRWAATAAIVLLTIVIGVRWAGRERPPDATSLLASAPVAAEAVSAPPLDREIAPDTTAEAATGDGATEQIAVDVIGAVAAPGIYRLQPTSRVDDAIMAAGGLAPDANRERINLAAPLEDGAQIRVPRVAEAAAAPAPGEQAPAPAQDIEGSIVNLNTADAATLEALPGIGPATAQAIIAYREANGPFASVDDLQNVKGIGPSLFGKLEGLVGVGE